MWPPCRRYDSTSSNLQFGQQPFLQDQNCCALDGDAGQGSRTPGAGVDVDPVAAYVRVRHRRMAMHNEFAVVLGRVEELVTDPDQVIGILVFDRDVGPDAGVNEQEVSTRKMIAQTLQKKLVRPWKGLEEAAVQVDFRLEIRVQIDAAGGKGLHAAQLVPMTKFGRVLKEILHQGLVIAAQAHRAVLNQPDGQHIDDGLRMGASIDIVTEIDLDRVLYRPASKVIADARDDVDQQVGPAVDVADRIDTRIRRRRSGNGLRRMAVAWSETSIMEPCRGQSKARVRAIPF
jgi:hypothetical protein